MRRLLVILLLLAPLAAQAQSPVSVQRCVWHAGNNPAWASPSYDDSGWKPYDSWVLNPSQPSYWFRCYADLSSFRNLPSPAIGQEVVMAYRVYLNGHFIGTNGNIKTGAYDVGDFKVFPFPPGIITKTPSVLAFHMVFKFQALPDIPLVANQTLVGKAQDLRIYHNDQRLLKVSQYLPVAICYGIIGVVGLILLGLYLTDPSRPELLSLALVCCLWAILRVELFFTYMPWHMGSTLYYSLAALGYLAIVFYVLFFFQLVHRRVPWFYRIVMALSTVWSVENFLVLVLPPREALLLSIEFRRVAFWYLVVFIIAAAAPLIAFWPYWKISSRMRPIAFFCMLWAFITIAWYAVQIPNNSGTPYDTVSLPEVKYFFLNNHVDLLFVSGLATTPVLIALLALLFRDQRRTAKERAVLSGEMQAAGNIQQMLVPKDVQTAPGIEFEVAYQPMREVGGDFYQCRILPDGTQRLLLGDVSGKGAAAAMTAAVLIGASDLRNSNSPQALLVHLNQVLCEKHLGGFATCLCADISPNAMFTVANAGHLSPYRNGDELELDSGLPLGITEAAEYTEISVQLTPGDQLTFISDGIIEARNSKGELYGFDRTREISHQSAQQIAETAQSFGQEDDITVLTLTLAPS